MASFQSRVEYYTGTVASTQKVTDSLSAGAKILVNKMSLFKANRIAADVAVPTTGLDVANYKTIGVHKEGYESREVGVGLKARVTNASSLEYACSESPAHYTDNGSLYVHPYGGTLRGVAFPDVLASATTVDNFPIEFIQAMILYAAIQITIGNINTAITSMDAISLASADAPTSLSAPSFSYSDASYSDVIASNAEYTTGAYTDALLATGTSTNAIASIVEATTIGILASAPSYTKPTTPSLTYASLSSALEDEDGALVNAFIGENDSKLRNLQTQMQDELNEFNQEDAIYQASVKKVLGQAQISLQEAIENARNTTTVDLDNKKRTDNVDMANAKIETDLNLANEAQTVNTDLTNKKISADLDLANKRSINQVALTNAEQNARIDMMNKQKTLEASVAEYTAKLNRYANEASLYTAQVNKAVGEFSVEVKQKYDKVGALLQILQGLRVEYAIALEGI